MSDRDTDTLCLLEKLARAAGAGGRPIHADVATEDYDWHVPFRYDGRQLTRLAEVGEVLARKIAQALGAHLRGDVRVASDAPTQHFRSRLGQDLAEAERYYVNLSAGETPCGVLLIAPALATGWVNRLLGAGGADEAKAGRELSELETDLLSDTAAVWVGAIAETLQQEDGRAIEQRGKIARGTPELPCDEGTEWCVFGFRSSEDAAAPEAILAVLCDVLDHIVAADADAHAAAGAAENGADLAEHFARVPLAAEVIAAEADLPVRDVLELQVGDVVLLPKDAEDPVELRVDRRAVLYGRAVTAEGHYGVAVLGACDAPAPPADTPRQR